MQVIYVCAVYLPILGCVCRGCRPQGNINVINAAIKKGVKKFVLVTSLGCGSTKDAIPAKVPWRRLVQRSILGQEHKLLTWGGAHSRRCFVVETPMPLC